MYFARKFLTLLLGWQGYMRSYSPYRIESCILTLEDFSQELKEKSDEKVPVMLKLKICQL